MTKYNRPSKYFSSQACIELIQLDVLLPSPPISPPWQ